MKRRAKGNPVEPEKDKMVPTKAGISAPALKPLPTAKEQLAIAGARERAAMRPTPPKWAATTTDAVLTLSSPHADEDGTILRMHDLFGSNSRAFVDLVTGQVGGLTTTRDPSSATGLNAALAVIAAVRPDNEVETLMAVQMLATHNLSVELMGRALRAQSDDVMQMNINMATKLQRSFSSQVEALDRHRRGGQQKVMVEHVHVHAGGQAVVGNIITGGGEGRKEKW